MNRPSLLLVVTVCLALPACISTYTPPHPVAPLLDEKGDVAIGGSVRLAQPKEGANAYVAVAPTKNLRLFVSGSLTRVQCTPA